MNIIIIAKGLLLLGSFSLRTIQLKNFNQIYISDIQHWLKVILTTGKWGEFDHAQLQLN